MTLEDKTVLDINLKIENAWSTMTLEKMMTERALGEDARRKDVARKGRRMRVIGNNKVRSSESSSFAVKYGYMSIKYSPTIFQQIISNHYL
jgi:hypothetical protein